MTKDQLAHQLDIVSTAIQGIEDKSLERLLTACTTAISSGNKIVISALGKGAYVAQKTVASLTSLGVDAVFLHSNDALHGDMGVIKKGDVLIALTKTGNTEETINLVRLFLQRDKNVWVIHCNDQGRVSALVENSVYIPLSHEGDLWNRMPMNSTVVFFLVLNQLVIEISKYLDITESDFLMNHPGGGIGRPD